MDSLKADQEGITRSTTSLDASSKQVCLPNNQEQLLKEIAFDIHLNHIQTKVQPMTKGEQS